MTVITISKQPFHLPHQTAARLTSASSRHSVRRRLNAEAVDVASYDGGDAEALSISRHVGSRERDGVVVAARAVVDGDGDGLRAGKNARSSIDADGGDEEGDDGLGLHFGGCLKKAGSLKSLGDYVDRSVGSEVAEVLDGDLKS